MKGIVIPVDLDNAIDVYFSEILNCGNTFAEDAYFRALYDTFDKDAVDSALREYGGKRERRGIEPLS